VTLIDEEVAIGRDTAVGRVFKDVLGANRITCSEKSHRAEEKGVRAAYFDIFGRVQPRYTKNVGSGTEDWCTTVTVAWLEEPSNRERAAGWRRNDGQELA